MNSGKPTHNLLSTTNFRKGQALVEVLVAISILTVGFLGVVTLLSRALALNRVVADNYTATYLASEGVEIVKNIIDRNAGQGSCWNCGIPMDTPLEVDFQTRTLDSTFSDRPLLFDTVSRRYGYFSEGQATTFLRKVTIEAVGSGQTELLVKSQVVWKNRGGGNSSIVLEDHFFNWK